MLVFVVVFCIPMGLGHMLTDKAGELDVLVSILADGTSNFFFYF